MAELTPPDGSFDPNMIVDPSLQPALNYTPNQPRPNGTFSVAKAIAAPAPTIPAKTVAAQPAEDTFSSIETKLNEIEKALPAQARAQLEALALEDPSSNPRARKFNLIGQILAGIGDVIATQVGPRAGAAGQTMIQPWQPNFLAQAQNKIERDQTQYDTRKHDAQMRILENQADQEKQITAQRLGIQMERGKETLIQNRETQAAQVRAAGDLMDIIQKGGDIAPSLEFLVKQYTPEAVPADGSKLDKGTALTALATSKDPVTGKYNFLGALDPTARTFIMMGLATGVKGGALGGKDALLKLFTNAEYLKLLVAKGVSPSEEYGRIQFGLDASQFQNKQAYAIALAEMMANNGTLDFAKKLMSIPEGVELPPTGNQDVAVLQGADAAGVGKTELNKKDADRQAGAQVEALTKQFSRVISTVPEAWAKLEAIRQATTPEAVNMASQAFAEWAAPTERKITQTDEQEKEFRVGYANSKRDIFTAFMSGKVRQLGAGNGPIKMSDLNAFLDDTIGQTMAPLAGYQDLDLFDTMQAKLWDEARAILRKAVDPKRLVNDVEPGK